MASENLPGVTARTTPPEPWLKIQTILRQERALGYSRQSFPRVPVPPGTSHPPKKGVFLPVVLGRQFTTTEGITRDAEGEVVGLPIIHSNEYVSRKHVSFNLIGQRGSFTITMTNHGVPFDQTVFELNVWTNLIESTKSIIKTGETVELVDNQEIRFHGEGSPWFRVRMNLECREKDDDLFTVVLEDVLD